MELLKNWYQQKHSIIVIEDIKKYKLQEVEKTFQDHKADRIYKNMLPIHQNMKF